MRPTTISELRTLANAVSERKDSTPISFLNITKEYAEATDGKVLIRHRIASPFIKIDLKKKKSVCVSPKILLKDAANLVIDDTKTTVTLSANISLAPVVFEHMQQNIFPDTQNVLNEIKKKKTVFKIAMGKKVLMKFLKSIPEYGNSGIADLVITFEFKGQEEAVYFSTSATEGAIMPILLPK